MGHADRRKKVIRRFDSKKYVVSEHYKKIFD
jgi:hypothetical protein